MIHHATREVTADQLEACIAFYGLLGFHPVPEPPGLTGRARWLEAGRDAEGVIGTADEINPDRDAEGVVGTAGEINPDRGVEGVRTQIHLMPIETAPVAAGHIGVVCPDYDATVAALEAAGHVVEPRRKHWGAPRAYVRDPAGHLVEVMAWAPTGRRE